MMVALMAVSVWSQEVDPLAKVLLTLLMLLPTVKVRESATTCHDVSSQHPTEVTDGYIFIWIVSHNASQM